MLMLVNATSTSKWVSFVMVMFNIYNNIVKL